jgi:hypothetical protein
MNYRRQHPFWGSISPLGGLYGFALLVMVSPRLSWAVAAAGSLMWVYITTSALAVLLMSKAAKAFPSIWRNQVFTCIACFSGTVYLFLFWLFSPLAAFEMFLPLMLVPLFYISSVSYAEIFASQNEKLPDIQTAIYGAAVEAAILSALLVLVSVIREPLGFCSLSLPGSSLGLVTLFSFREGAFFPVRIFASSAGAFLLLGYILCLYRYFRSIYAPLEGDK